MVTNICVIVRYKYCGAFKSIDPKSGINGINPIEITNKYGMYFKKCFIKKTPL